MLLIIVSRMLDDLFLFLVLCTGVIAGFGLALCGIFYVVCGITPLSEASYDEIFAPPHVAGEGWTLTAVMSVPVWALVGEPSLDQVQASSPMLGSGLLWVYVVLANVVLVNLLIAMMSATYSKCVERPAPAPAPVPALAPAYRVPAAFVLLA